MIEFLATHREWMYGIFVVFILGMLALDLGVFHRTAHKVSIKESLGWTAVWMVLALLFGAGVWYFGGPIRGQEYLTGYLLEKALAVENIMVFVMIFSFFRVPQVYQHKVLFWGVIGALIFRSIFIGAGAALVASFSWIMYVFAVILLITAFKMFFLSGHENEPADNFVMRFVQKVLPVSSHYNEDKFTIMENGKRLFTPLFAALLAIELADVVFAVDSIPAIFAVTDDPFIVYTSNIFAILGLRSLYFVSAELVSRFRYLTKGVAVVLLVIAVKMLIIEFYKIPITAVLGVMIVVFGISIYLSEMARRKDLEVGVA